MKARGILALDDLALGYAKNLSARQPRCDLTIPQLPTTTPVLSDIVPISRPEFIPGGGYDYGVSLLQLQALIGSGGGTPSILFNTNLSAVTIYNYGNFVGTVPGSGGSASLNTAALSTMLSTMAGANGLGGGYAWIPQYNFSVNSSQTGLTVPANCIFQALGTGGNNGTQGYHFAINEGTGGGPYTFLNVSGPHNSGGTYFNNLAFQWKAPVAQLDTCLNLNIWNASARDCTFTDCPTAINIQGLGSLVDHCTISYGIQSGIPTSVTAVLLQAIDAQINGPCEINGSSGAGTTGGTCTAISIGGGVPNCNECTISRVHMVGWSYCIDYSDMNNTGIGSGTQDNVIRDCVMEAAITCVYMVPFSTAGQIFNQKYIGCTITKGQNSTDGSPIFLIDATPGFNSYISAISLTDCTIFSNVTGGSGQGGTSHTGVAQNNQYGVKIGAVNSVSIIGGRISQMGGANATTGSANICISGAPTSVLIDSVNLSNSYGGVNAGRAQGSLGSGNSYYGLLVSGSPALVQVNDCDFSGCTVPVGVTGNPLKLYVNNCIAYNNQNTAINTLANITTGTAYQASLQGSNSGTSYYGPSFVMFTANASGGTFQYNGGTAQTLIASQVVCLTLASPYDTIQFNTHAPAAFQWLGK